MDKKKNLTEELGLTEGYKNLVINGKNYVLRVPSAIEQIRLEDDSSDLNGNMDTYTYIEGILKLVSPELQIKNVVIRKSNEIKTGNITLSFSKLTPEKAFKIILNGSKVGLDSNGETVMKVNQAGMLEDIFANSDEKTKIGSATKNDLKEILKQFQELFDVEGAMKVYDTFQQSVQD